MCLHYSIHLPSAYHVYSSNISFSLYYAHLKRQGDYSLAHAASLGISTIHITSRRIYVYYIFLRLRSYASDFSQNTKTVISLQLIKVFTSNLECSFSRYIRNTYIKQEDILITHLIRQGNYVYAHICLCICFQDISRTGY